MISGSALSVALNYLNKVDAAIFFILMLLVVYDLVTWGFIAFLCNSRTRQSVRPHFHAILPRKSINSFIFVIEGHRQGRLQSQKVNSKVKGITNIIFSKHKYCEEV